MKHLTLKVLEQHQDEVLSTLNKEKEAVEAEVQRLLDKRDIINDTIARFQTQILMAQTKWKLDEKN